MALNKKKTSGFASLLIKDRFQTGANKANKISKNSITEYRGFSILDEKLSVENKQIYNSKNAQEMDFDLETKYHELLENINYDLSIPPRIPFRDVEKGDFKQLENIAFNRWKYLNKEKIFERNIEVWRQFWLTCEKADTLIQILDSRTPASYFNQDIMKMYPTKQHVLFFNKSDLINNPETLEHDINNSKSELVNISGHYIYSAKTNVFDFPLKGTVGLIGYPNVGKSSTINLILKQKRVKVSSTPGKTKYIQTIETPDFTLLDCPGLVFPHHERIDLVLMGILNIDQISDLEIYEKTIINFIGESLLQKYYKVPEYYRDFLTAMSIHKGWGKLKCLKILTKDYIAGNIK